MKLRHIAQLLFGISTFIPGVYKWRSKKTGSGGAYSAKYCYSVYLRHMVMVKKSNLNTSPKVVAELGPGDSLGVGLMALLLGAEKYYAFDAVKFASTPKNLKMLDELIQLLEKQESIPNDKDFPRIKPKLNDYHFPIDIYSNKYLKYCLSSKRIDQIRFSIINNNGMVEYKAPWFEESNIIKDSVDMIISQAVLEHIDDLNSSYSAMYKWLKPNGFMTHCIDFKCHGKSDVWDGHWKISDLHWFLLRGARSYLINREPFSVHSQLIKSHNFKLGLVIPTISTPTFNDMDLNPRFKSMSKIDRETSGVFIQAEKVS